MGMDQYACKLATMSALQQTARTRGLKKYRHLTKAQLCRLLLASGRGGVLASAAGFETRKRVRRGALHPLRDYVRYGRLSRSWKRGVLRGLLGF